MKAKVIERFHDKHTLNLHAVGSMYESSDKRVKELQKKGFLESPPKETGSSFEEVESNGDKSGKSSNRGADKSSRSKKPHKR
jgi:hypothetical protein